MATPLKDLIKSACVAFNDSDMSRAPSTMHPGMQWSKAQQGSSPQYHFKIETAIEHRLNGCYV